MNLRRPLHRPLQVARHLLALAHEAASLTRLVPPPGSAGRRRLRELGASPALIDAFTRAHPADRTAAARLAATIRRAGAAPAEQFAALIHDLPKGRAGLPPRVLHVLLGSPQSATWPGDDASSLARLRGHAAEAPRLAARLGAPLEVVQILEALAAQERDGTAVDARAARIFAADSGEAR